MVFSLSAVDTADALTLVAAPRFGRIYITMASTTYYGRTPPVYTRQLLANTRFADEAVSHRRYLLHSRIYCFDSKSFRS